MSNFELLCQTARNNANMASVFTCLLLLVGSLSVNTSDPWVSRFLFGAFLFLAGWILAWFAVRFLAKFPNAELFLDDDDLGE